MLLQVEMKELAIAKIELDKETASTLVEVLGNSIENMMKEYPEEKQRQICALMDLKYVFESIERDFRK